MLLIENPFPPFTADELAELFPDGFDGWEREHASMVETSLMLVARPDLVRTDRIADDRSERFPSWDLLPAPADYLTGSGVLAEPSRSSVELGLSAVGGGGRPAGRGGRRPSSVPPG